MTTTTSPQKSTELNRVLEVAPQTVRQWLASGECLLVDVREPDEHAREHIAGSRLHPLSKFDTSRLDVSPGSKIVFHCRSGKRSADAANRTLSGNASTVQIYTMSGGIEAWKQDGLPVELNTNVSRISVMRQVQLVVGVGVLLGCTLGWMVHPAFLILPLVLGAGLTVAGASGTCGLATVLSMMPWNRNTGANS